MDDAAGFLGRLTVEDADALRAAGREKQLMSGVPVAHEGEPAHEVVVVLSGSVKITSTSVDGREVVVGVRAENELIGELSAIDGGLRSASVWTLGPTRVLSIPVPAFRRLLDERASISRALLDLLAARLRESVDQALELGTEDALARVIRRLLEQVRPGGASDQPPVIELSMSQQELADRSGLSREAVVKALRVLRSLGWIEQQGRRVVLLDVRALRERAGLTPDAPS